MPGTPGREADVAFEFWLYLARKAKLHPRLAQKAWRAIRRSPDVQTWRYVLEQALRPEVWPLPDPLRRGPCQPGAVVEALEWAVRQHTMTRKDATAIEEKLLLLVDKEGVWR